MCSTYHAHRPHPCQGPARWHLRTTAPTSSPQTDSARPLLHLISTCEYKRRLMASDRRVGHRTVVRRPIVTVQASGLQRRPRLHVTETGQGLTHSLREERSLVKITPTFHSGLLCEDEAQEHEVGGRIPRPGQSIGYASGRDKIIHWSNAASCVPTRVNVFTIIIITTTTTTTAKTSTDSKSFVPGLKRSLPVATCKCEAHGERPAQQASARRFSSQCTAHKRTQPRARKRTQDTPNNSGGA